MLTLFPLLIGSAFLGSAVSYSDLYLYHVLAFITAVSVLFKNLLPFIIFTWHQNKVWIFITLYSIASIAWAKWFGFALKYNAYLLCGVFLIFTTSYLFRIPGLKERSLKILSILFFIHLGLALIEILTPLRWPISDYSTLNSYFGRDSQPHPDFFEYYPTSFFWHQNNCAIVTLMGLPTLFKSQNRYKLVPILVCYLVIFFCGSKSVLLLAAGYGFFGLIKYLPVGNISLKQILLTSLAFLVTLATGYQLSNQVQKQELTQAIKTLGNYVSPSANFLLAKVKNTPFDFNQINESVRERYFLMDGAIDLYKESPILGIGAGSNLPEIYQKNNYYVPLRSIHNYFLELIMVYGPIVSAIYFAWIVSLLRSRNEYKETLILFLLAAPVLSSAIYFLPKWLLYAFCNSELVNARQQANL